MGAADPITENVQALTFGKVGIHSDREEPDPKTGASSVKDFAGRVRHHHTSVNCGGQPYDLLL